MSNGLKSIVAKAYARCKPGRDALYNASYRCMEVTEDRAGIVWERWISPHGLSVILFATPSWWDVYVTLDELGTTSSAVDAIREYSYKKP